LFFLPKKSHTLAFPKIRNSKPATRTMQQYLANIALVVRDYDEAIEFYTQKLGFELIEDTPLSPEKRWVRVRPRGSQGCCLLLAKAVFAYRQF